MKKAIKVMLAVWIVIALVLGGFLVRGIVYGNFSFGGFRNGRWGYVETAGDYKVASDQSLDIQGVTKLDMDFGSPEVTIIPIEGNELRVVQRSVDDLKQDELIQVEKQGSTIRVRTQNPITRMIVFGFQWPQKIDVYVPESYAEQLDLTLRSGDLYMRDMDFTESKVKLSSGSMELENVNFSDLDLGVSSGDMNIDNTQADRINIKLSSGFIRGEDLRCKTSNIEVQSGDLNAYMDCDELDISVSSGSVDVYNDTAPSKLRAVVRSGDCVVAIPDNDGFTLDYKVSSGDFTNEFGEDGGWENRSGNTTYGVGQASRHYSIDVSSGFLKLARR